MVRLRRIAAALVAAFVVGAAALPPASAQAPTSTQAPATAAPATAPVAVPAIAAPVVIPPNPARAALDAARIELEQAEAATARESLSSAALQELRTRVDGIAERFRDVISALAPQLDSARARLEQLGPKPAATAPEGADVARDRTEREAAVAALDDLNRIGRALLLQSEQLTTQISDRRRAAFTAALFERSYGLLGPTLWTSVAMSFPRDLRALQYMASDAAGRFNGRASPTTLTLLALAIGAAIAFHIARRQIAPRLVHRPRDAVQVTEKRKLLSALGILVFDALPAAAGSFVIYQLVAAADVLPPRLDSVLAAILGGLAFVAFAGAAADATLAPGRTAWRLFDLSDVAAQRLSSFAIGFASIVAIGRVLDAANQAIAATLPLSIAARGLVVLVAALTLAELLRRFARTEDQTEDCLGPYIPPEPEIGGPVRLVGWVVAALMIASLVAGYVAFGSFIMEQIAWIGSIAALFALLVALADEFIGRSLGRDGRFSTTLQANLGLRRRKLEQLGVVGAGFVRVVLVIVAAMLALAPWGVSSGDITSNLRAAFFGFQVGEVTISLSKTIGALLLFAGVIAATRILQRWLAKTFLPTTDLDAGLRNSLETAAGYLGFFAAAALALSILGLGLEKIAIVAGALSVGIGFGLQSIVNNFVSGLILLWERPIRVGDLVVIGDGEGYVRRISVRATEIETFDRSSVIIPNSNLISGVVKNRVRGDRTGRIILSLRIGRDKDPVKAGEILTEHARRHPDVLSVPEPRVSFKTFAEAGLDLDLTCFVDDVTKQVRVQSDLNFAIYKALVEAGIMPMPGPAVTTIAGIEDVQAALRGIAEALADAKAKAGPAQGPAARIASPTT